MFNKKLAILLAPLVIVGCGSDSDTTQPQTALVSFSISDAPVDDADAVVVAFDAIELKHESGQSYFINVVDTETSDDYQQINLLDYQGTDAKLIVSDERIQVGSYKEMILHTKSGNSYNWVIANGTHDLKIPSNKLKLGGFEVSEETVQAFTIEFDLRKALVQRGNNSNNNGYNLKPHGVSIVDNSSAASLKGTVDVNLFSAGEACTADTGNFVYLYAGHNHTSDVLIDNIDENDPDYRKDTELPEGYVAPYASASVTELGNYAFGYIPAGAYTVAFSCSATDDDPIQYDQLIIPNPEEQVAEIELSPTQEKIYDFVEILR